MPSSYTIGDHLSTSLKKVEGGSYASAARSFGMGCDFWKRAAASQGGNDGLRGKSKGVAAAASRNRARYLTLERKYTKMVKERAK